MTINTQNWVAPLFQATLLKFEKTKPFRLVSVTSKEFDGKSNILLVTTVKPAKNS